MGNPPDSAADRDSLTHMVLALVPAWEPSEIGGFDYLSGGYSNENYRFQRAGETFVLRVPSRRRPFVDRGHEAAFYQRAQPVRTAALVAFDTDTGRMITRFVDGVLLADALPPLEEVARYLTTLHAALPPSGRGYDPVGLAREYLAEGQAPAWIRRLADGINWAPDVTHPCHNDLNPWNVVIPDRGSWVTLDWEWFGDNDPLFDVVTLHQGLGLEEHSLRGLAQTVQGDAVEAARLQRCLIAFWLREYAWAHAERVHGNRRAEVAAQLALAQERLRRLQSGSSSG